MEVEVEVEKEEEEEEEEGGLKGDFSNFSDL